VLGRTDATKDDEYFLLFLGSQLLKLLATGHDLLVVPQATLKILRRRGAGENE